MDERSPSRKDDDTRWPRRRSVDPRRRWDPDRTSEDVPTVASTIALTVLGVAVLAALAWLSMTAAGGVAGLLLLWSIGVEVTGNTLSTRVRRLPHRLLWVLVRPAYAVGLAVWAVLESLADLF